MPFQETGALAERIALLRDYDTGVFSVAELGRSYGVTRATVYVWTRRRDAGDPRWFEDRSHAPTRCPHATPEAVAEQLGGVRVGHLVPVAGTIHRQDPERIRLVYLHKDRLAVLTKFGGVVTRPLTVAAFVKARKAETSLAKVLTAVLHNA